MFKKTFVILLMNFFTTFVLADQSNEPLILNGKNLTIDDVVNVARFNQKVKISPEARDRVDKSHELLLNGAKFNMPIYGLNRGVGLNKDRKIFKGDTIDPEIKNLGAI